MNYKVNLHKNGNITELNVPENTNLLKCIQEQVSDFFAPCGGNGTCGKCRVNIPNEGHVTSCLYYVHKNIDVILPKEAEMKVLSSQHNLTKNVMLMPGKTAMLAPVPLGLAVDIGTTTMVFYVVNLIFGSVIDIRTSSNPQSKFGADVISRINYGVENDNGIKELQSVLINPINKAIEEHCAEYEILKTDFVKVSIVGNTTMLHNIMGVNALSIAHAPFTPTFTDAKTVEAKSLNIDINEQAEVVLSPSLSGYIGADIIAGLASVDTTKLGKTYLFVDIVTNGEIVLVTPDNILTCATAAGPAFEGANISCGMSAVTGAISEYNSSDYKVVGDAEPKGICGSGLIDIIAVMLDKGTLQSDGNITEDYIVYDGKTEQNLIALNQQDIREVQLAKSAIAAGINRMLALAGIAADDLDHVLLAGGFGNYINIKSAMRIGLLPNLPIDKYITIGNSAGSGAVLALKSEQFVNILEELKNKMEYIELSTDSEFSMEYAMNMFFS